MQPQMCVYTSKENVFFFAAGNYTVIAILTSQRFALWVIPLSKVTESVHRGLKKSTGAKRAV